MYDDAPYQVQRDFRELDKKIRTLHTEYHDFFEVDPKRIGTQLGSRNF